MSVISSSYCNVWFHTHKKIKIKNHFYIEKFKMLQTPSSYYRNLKVDAITDKGSLILWWKVYYKVLPVLQSTTRFY